MHVKMRNALADTIVHRHERALRFQRNFNRARQQLHILEKRSHEIRWKVAQSFEVIFRDKQTVSGEERAMIKKRERYIILEDDRRANFAADDSTEKTSHVWTTAMQVSQLSEIV